MTRHARRVIASTASRFWARSGKAVVDRKDTIRTNFGSQGAGSSGTLAHPFAEKISEKIKDAKLK